MQTKLIVLLICLTVAAFGAQLSVDPNGQTINVSQNTAVDIEFDENIGDFDIEIAWDSSIVQFLGYTLGTGLGDPTAGEALAGDVPGGSSINIFEVSLLPSANLLALQGAPPVTLLTLNFRGLSPGVSPVDVSVTTIGDENGIPFTAPVVAVDGSITVRGDGGPIVPEPSTTVLMMAGGFALVLARRCKTLLR
jgi:hypothetical protein